ncbi:unnamed protein product [Didymodactylos carnosus]|uniref:PAP-associated domain-containing protein n=1 Tax=Didymodactylos carnosus TaxID=1234261 RepID=A0A814MHR2_9BILA|nr:unnamed protein product [Didymodactylos carnosus]CAF1078715.1 unnamed protein product [Didymodactylos carnosus]CAF3583194.1 unnamed protein product [Didymodactylos carnosus]CAF3844874.1 unnamed protein product [Didymodactylos carnosus]
MKNLNLPWNIAEETWNACWEIVSKPNCTSIQNSNTKNILKSTNGGGGYSDTEIIACKKRTNSPNIHECASQNDLRSYYQNGDSSAVHQAKTIKDLMLPIKSKQKQNRNDKNNYSVWRKIEIPSKLFDFMACTASPTIPLLRLHYEIVQFEEFIKPKCEEAYVRQQVVDRIKSVIHEHVPNAILYLPRSDLDLLVYSVDQRNWKDDELYSLMKTLKDAFCKCGISTEGNINVLNYASTPIIKLVDNETELRVDMSFNMNNGVRSAHLISKYLKEFPLLRYLVFVLKQYLVQHDLNEVWTGGISSYSLILMLVNFFQLHCNPDIEQFHMNLGDLLIRFLELYGLVFNYGKFGIKVQTSDVSNKRNGYIPKDELFTKFNCGHRSTGLLCIVDPFNENNDIGKASYKTVEIKNAFRNAFDKLQNAVNPTNPVVDKSRSILGQIIVIDDDLIKYRKRLHNYFHTKLAPQMIIPVAQQQQQSYSMCSTIPKNGVHRHFPNNQALKIATTLIPDHHSHQSKSETSQPQTNGNDVKSLSSRYTTSTDSSRAQSTSSSNNTSSSSSITSDSDNETRDRSQQRLDKTVVSSSSLSINSDINNKFDDANNSSSETPRVNDTIVNKRILINGNQTDDDYDSEKTPTAALKELPETSTTTTTNSTETDCSTLISPHSSTPSPIPPFMNIAAATQTIDDKGLFEKQHQNYHLPSHYPQHQYYSNNTNGNYSHVNNNRKYYQNGAGGGGGGGGGGGWREPSYPLRKQHQTSRRHPKNGETHPHRTNSYFRQQQSQNNNNYHLRNNLPDLISPYIQSQSQTTNTTNSSSSSTLSSQQRLSQNYSH